MNAADPRYQWVQDYVQGTATPKDMTSLEAELSSDEDFREFFLEYLNLDLELSLSAVLQEPAVHPFPAQARFALAAAAAAFVLWVGFLFSGPWMPFATVAGSVGTAAFEEGAPIRGEAYQLENGILELKTSRGVQIILEAPATFQFQTAQRLRLLHGRAAADVPEQGKGFTVTTPTGKAVDLGTTFGVDVPLEGEAEVHVFQGEVIAQSTGGAKHSLRQGEAFSLQKGAGVARELRSAAFIRSEEVDSLRIALGTGQHTRSEGMLAELREDPALIALLDFESAELPEGSYRMAQGRFPGSHAPEFVEVGAHMKLDVGGEQEWPQLTLAAWVRLDRLGEPFQSLLHTDGWWNQEHAGQVHWMVTQKHTMRLALYGNTLAEGAIETQSFPDSRTSVLPEQGRWMHLATVYDVDRRTVRFYLNGEFDSQTLQEQAYPARLGPAQIGNWDQHDRKLSGRLDELLLLGRAMSDAEIQDLFAAGNPYH